MSTYSYKNPKFINSPKGMVEVVEVIYDGKDDPAYSLAIIKWENIYKLGIRWNIAYSEWDDYRKQNGQDECIGNPQSRGIPTWFVLPDDMMFSEKFTVRCRGLMNQEKVSKQWNREKSYYTSRMKRSSWK